MKIKSIIFDEKKRVYEVFFEEGKILNIRSLNTIADFHMIRGKVIKEGDLKEIIFQDLLNYYKSKTLSKLSKKNRSQKHIIDYLKLSLKKDDIEFDQSEKLVSKVINYLTDLGYLDDEKFANDYYEVLKRKKSLSASVIKRKLISTGLEKSVAEDLVFLGLEDEYSNCLSVAQSKFDKLSQKNLADKEKKQKLYQFLSYKGFKWATISKVFEHFNL